MRTRAFRRWSAALGAVGAVALSLLAATALGSSKEDPSTYGDWVSWGRTPTNLRYSPLTGINTDNVAQLGRAYTIDFRQVDPDVRTGEQSFPLAIGGILYVTTNDANVFAVDGASGKILWQRKPTNKAVFKNFGVAANRGVSYCGGKLFILQLDMKLVSIDPATGKELGFVALNQDVPNASVKYGYSETSTPICEDNTLFFGAAGSERGNRGWVMAYTTDLKPAWPSPFWTIPPDGWDWRSQSRIVGGGSVWTPVTVDASTHTVFFGTGQGTPSYFPALHPGKNPRTAAIIAVDEATGKLKWWQELIENDQWEYDASQPPVVFDTKIAGKLTHVVTMGTKEGTWFLFDANTGKAIQSRVKVIDRVEHPPLKPGVPVTIFPGSIGGLNFSPGAWDPKTGYVFNAAAETAAVLIQHKLTPTEKLRKFQLGDVFLGVDNGNFGSYLPGWHDHGSVSAIDPRTGQRVWKFDTPEPERGGVTTTAGGVGFAGGGDGNLRAFDLKTGKVLWTFQTGNQIAAGATVFLGKDGKEYVAITSGGTPTSSNGGTAAKLHVFALGASQKQSTGPTNLPAITRDTSIVRTTQAAKHPARGAAPARTAVLARATASAGRFQVAGGGVVDITNWDPNSSNLAEVKGTLTLGGKPVAGAKVSVDRYTIPQATGSDGSFTATVDATMVRRHVLGVADASGARVDGRAASDADKAAILRTSGGIAVGYRVSDVKVSSQGSNVVVTGRVSRTDNAAPPKVVHMSFRLSGRVLDAKGNPVKGAYVVTRTLDRDYWTFSDPTDDNGTYTSFFPASDQSGSDPVQYSLQVAYGQTNYAVPAGKEPTFKALSSATLDITLPASGTSLATPTSTPVPGAYWKGVVVGVTGPGGVVKPVSATWTDARGGFQLVLPGSVKGQTLGFWETDLEAFSSAAGLQKAGGPIDVATWPKALTARVARDLASVAVG